jgi:hypothetical protein
MSTEREPLAQEPKLTVRVRPAKLVLAADPADEELARDWTLSEADKAEVRRCRGDTSYRALFSVSSAHPFKDWPLTHQLHESLVLSADRLSRNTTEAALDHSRPRSCSR